MPVNVSQSPPPSTGIANLTSGFCGNTLQGVGAPAPDGEAQCNMACNGNQTEICGGPNRLSFFRYYKGNEPPVSSTSKASSSSTAAPVPTGLPNGFAYKGCYVDGPGYRVMQNQQPDDQQMTIASCSSRCATLGYTVAGMEYHTQVNSHLFLFAPTFNLVLVLL
jgi:hypothetical protein